MRKVGAWFLIATLAASCRSDGASARTETPPSPSAASALPPSTVAADAADPAHAAAAGDSASTSDDAARLANEAGASFESGDRPRALALFRAAYDAGNREPKVCGAVSYLEALDGRIDESVVWLERAVDLGYDEVDPVRNDPRLAPLLADPRVPPLLDRMRANAEKHLAERGVGSGLVRSTPQAEGLDDAALQALLDDARASHSSAVIVLHEGRVAVEEYFGGLSRRIEAMSATKSIVSLAVGLAIDEGKLSSVDLAVHELYPEWRQGKKEAITVRHLLNHTSGMQANPTTQEIYRSPDFVELALAADLDDEPGARFFYNNKAVNLLPAIVERATGMRMDEYLRAKLFRPLGIQDVTWSLDRAGHPHGLAGLQIHPIDLAKIGQMLLDGGTWNGERILSERWIAESATRTGQELVPVCGFLWWLVASDRTTTLPADGPSRMEAVGLDAESSAKVADLFGVATTTEKLQREIAARLGDDGAGKFWSLLATARIQPEIRFTSIVGYSARGYRGQYLVVLPAARIVAVRMTDDMHSPDDEVSMASFTERVRALSK